MQPPRPDGDHEALLALARRHGLALTAGGLETSEAGLDFRVAFATDEEGTPWVLRVPRRADVVPRAEVEARVLALVRERLPVAVPDWRVHTPELIAYPRLPGTPGLTMDPATMEPIWHLDRASAVFARSFGEALAALHGIDHGDAGRAGLPVSSPAEARRALADEVETVRREVGASDARWRRWQDWLADDGYWPAHSALIHGDLYAAHVLVDDASRATGILDWTEARVADPATDFIFHLMGFGETGLDHLLAEYAHAGGRVWPRMREHVAELLFAFPVKYALFALRTGQDDHLAAARAQLLA